MLRQNYKNKKNSLLFPVLTIFLLLFFLFAFKGFPPSFFSKYISNLTQPVFVLKNKINNYIEENKIILKEKKDIVSENENLKQKIKELETKIDFVQVIEKQNEELKNILSRNTERKLIFAGILERPIIGNYSFIIIDAGKTSGIEEGMKAIAFENILIGEVAEVFEESSRVRLVSFPDNKINVVIDNLTTATANGEGGENLSIKLPYDMQVSEGSIIMTEGINPFFLGNIGKIEKEETDAFQTIFFRLPINIRELKNIYLIK